jgi:hypothetical protein
MTPGWKLARRRIFEAVCKKAGGEKGLEKDFFKMTKGGEHFHQLIKKDS